MTTWIDVRSDTVTRPTSNMYAAIQAAELGDDGYRDDPTMLRLECLAADLTGKEAAVLTVSGTMSNLLAALTWGETAGEILAEAESHMVISEVCGATVLASQVIRELEGVCGRVAPELFRAHLHSRADGRGLPTSVVWLENTRTASGGRVLDESYLAAVQAVCRDRAPIHVDGARLFNACARLDRSVADLCRVADSISLSLCKGLSAPLGSVLCGSREFIERARTFRKMIDGGMRQADVIAAAGIVALTEMPAQARQDNDRAAELAARLGRLSTLLIDPGSVETNILLLDTGALPAEVAAQRLLAAHIRARPSRSGHLRMVVHRHIGSPEVDHLTEAVGSLLGEMF